MKPVHALVSKVMILLGPLFLLGACSDERNSFLNPAGPIAAAQRDHLISVFGWTMIAIIPVFILVPLMFWRYRYRAQKSRYEPDWEYSGWLDILMWGVPFVIITVLSVQLWHSTHALDPYKPIASTKAPTQVQVVGLDWKWLFIYPDLGIATVNELAFPVGSSVALEVTTDTVMQSFMISALAGQIYAMPGMRTKLHVLADVAGQFDGENTQFNGAGFTDQKFKALAMSDHDFDTWVAQVKSKGIALDQASYGQLAKASTGAQAHATLGSAQMPQGVPYFNLVDAYLFEQVLGRYMNGTAVPPELQPGAVGYVPPRPVKDARK